MHSPGVARAAVPSRGPRKIRLIYCSPRSGSALNKIKIDAKILGKYSSQKIIFLYGKKENLNKYSQNGESL
jgi:hypothetical protein